VTLATDCWWVKGRRRDRARAAEAPGFERVGDVAGERRDRPAGLRRVWRRTPGTGPRRSRAHGRSRSRGASAPDLRQRLAEDEELARRRKLEPRREAADARRLILDELPRAAPGSLRSAVRAVRWHAMASQMRGAMYCKECDRPVAAQRGAHRTRNTLAAFLTGDCGMEVEPWHCPHCGGPVVPERRGSSDRGLDARRAHR